MSVFLSVQLLNKLEPLNLTISLPQSIMSTYSSVVLIFGSVDEILWCEHSNETPLAVLLHGTIYFSVFNKMNFEIVLEFLYWRPWRLKG